MPRNVRNFWIELTIDGAAKRIETGPKSKDGGFTLTILQRDKGGIVKAAEVWGHMTSDGMLKLETCIPGEHATPIVFTTRR